VIRFLREAISGGREGIREAVAQIRSLRAVIRLAPTVISDRR